MHPSMQAPQTQHKTHNLCECVCSTSYSFSTVISVIIWQCYGRYCSQCMRDWTSAVSQSVSQSVSACRTEQVQSVSQSVHAGLNKCSQSVSQCMSKLGLFKLTAGKISIDTIVQTFKSCLLKSVFWRTDWKQKFVSCFAEQIENKSLTFLWICLHTSHFIKCSVYLLCCQVHCSICAGNQSFLSVGILVEWRQYKSTIERDQNSAYLAVIVTVRLYCIKL